MELQRFCGFRLGSIGEMIKHGYAKDNAAGEKAILAGSDMDMESRIYMEQLPKLVKKEKWTSSSWMMP
jgi:beta-glucosidase